MTNTELFGHRILEFTRAEAILAALVIDVDNMQSSLTSHLPNLDKTLASQLGAFRAAAVDQWMKGTGVDNTRYESGREAVIRRAHSLQRRALAAAEAAAAIAMLIDGMAPLTTPEELAARIDGLAAAFYDGEYASDADAAGDLIAVWHALTPSALVSPEHVDALRRYYDTQITGPYNGSKLPGLYAMVTEWRDEHLNTVAWDADTWEYAAATVRSWEQVRNLWEALGDGAQREPLTAAQNVRLRTTLADRVKSTPSDHAQPPRELVEAVTEFDNAHMWLMTRIRGAETMADLIIVANVLGGHDPRNRSSITLTRALARRFDVLATTAPDADSKGDTWANASVLAQRVQEWRQDLYTNAMGCTTARGVTDYDPESRYILIDCALADARHTGHHANLGNLLATVDRVATAGADHILTPEHIQKLRAACAQNDTAAIQLNGGTH